MQSLTLTRHAQCAKPPEEISIFSRILYKKIFLRCLRGGPGSPRGRGPVSTTWNYVSSSKAAEAAEATGKCALPATALGSLPRQSCGAAVFHRQSGGAAGGREEVPGGKAGGAEPLSPGCCPAAGQGYAFNGGSTAVCGEGEVSAIATKSSVVHMFCLDARTHDVIKCNLTERQYVCVDSGTMVISFFQ